MLCPSPVLLWRSSCATPMVSLQREANRCPFTQGHGTRQEGQVQRRACFRGPLRKSTHTWKGLMDLEVLHLTELSCPGGMKAPCCQWSQPVPYDGIAGKAGPVGTWYGGRVLREHLWPCRRKSGCLRRTCTKEVNHKISTVKTWEDILSWNKFVELQWKKMTESGDDTSSHFRTNAETSGHAWKGWL